MEAQARRQKLRLDAKNQALHNQPPQRTMLPNDTVRVAYQGEPGAYSEQAAAQFFTARDQPTHFHPCASFAEMFEALDQGLVETAAVPIENLLKGNIHENFDLLLRYTNTLTIIGELDFRVRHCLLAMKGVTLADVNIVRSHYMALDQCSVYLRSKGLTQEVAYDTAGSAKLIRKTGATDAAAIASRRAAEIYGLDILAEHIEDEELNFTRFLILSKRKSSYIPGTPSKTSLVFTLRGDGPGILHRALSVFAVTNINLTKIESRHLHTVREALSESSEQFKKDDDETRWGYVFFVDIARHSEEKDVASALEHLQQITPFYRVLGSYPRHVRELHD